MQQTVITVNSRKYDQSVRRSWTCRLTERNDTLFVFVGEFAFDVSHPDLGEISKGTVSYEYYWLDRWFNIFRFHHPDGTFRNWYCNVNMPPNFDGRVLDYVDLDIDILIWPGGEPQVLDEDEFAMNAAEYRYPTEILEQALSAKRELLAMYAARKFPFDLIETG